MLFNSKKVQINPKQNTSQTKVILKDCLITNALMVGYITDSWSLSTLIFKDSIFSETLPTKYLQSIKLFSNISSTSL